MLKTWVRTLFLWQFKVPRDIQRYAFRRYSNRIFLQSADRALSYGELENRAYRLVQAWKAMGISKNDIVFTQVRVEKELFELRIAALEVGVILTTFHEAHTPDFLVYAAHQAQPKLCIIDTNYGQGSVKALVQAFPEMKIWCTGPGGEYEQQIQTHQAARSSVTISPEDVMTLGFTSGTTGQPKGVLSSHGAAINSLKLLVNNLDTIPDDSTINVSLTAIPMVGAGSGLVMPTMLSGGKLVLMDYYSPEYLCELVEKHRVTRLFLTPSQLIDLLEMPESVDRALKTVSHIVYGTAPMPAAKLEEAIRRFGPIFQQGYGQAEILPPVSMLRRSDHLQQGKIADRQILRSCGRVVDGVRVRISSPNGDELPIGEWGEVHVKTPTRFKSYLNPEHNKGVILKDGFFVTGDHGYLDQQGFLHILDRQTDLITTDEGTIYPRLIEEEAHDYPAVRECCYVLVNNKKILCISIRKACLDQSKEKIEDGVMTLLKSRIAPWQWPDKIEFLAEMPRSLLGKVLRREVRALLSSH